nr:lankamycin synthase, modules 5 and 6 [uncultured bacterium]
MPVSHPRRAVRRGLTIAVAAVTALIGAAGPAAAVHQPVVLDRGDVIPCLAPLSRDGTDEVVFLGTLHRAHAVRGLQIRMRAGERLDLEYFVPDLAPENTLSPGVLPKVYLIAPDRQVEVIEATFRFPFTNPDNGQKYLALASYETLAAAGTYSVLVTGPAESRFAVAHGREDAGSTFDGVLRGRIATGAEVDRWYATAP